MKQGGKGEKREKKKKRGGGGGKEDKKKRRKKKRKLLPKSNPGLLNLVENHVYTTRKDGYFCLIALVL